MLVGNNYSNESLTFITSGLYHIVFCSCYGICAIMSLTFEFYISSGVKVSPKARLTSLFDMERDSNFDGKHTYMLCQILYYKLNNNAQSTKLSVYARGKNATDALAYRRIMFLRCLASSAGLNVFVILLGKHRNPGLFNADLDGRDTGHFQPGSYVLLSKPAGILSWMSGHSLPILDVPNSLLCVSPTSFSHQEKIPVPFDPTSLRIQAFSYPMAQVRASSFHVVPTCCSGMLCGALDTQPMNGVAMSACPCFHTLKREGNLVFLLSLVVTVGPSAQDTFIVRNFSSKPFTNRFLKGGIPSGVTAAKILSLNIEDDLMDAVDSALEEANKKGGLTVTGWLRRGLFDDEGDISCKEKVVSGDLTHHLINIEFNDQTCVDNHLVDIYSLMSNQTASTVGSKKKKSRTN